MSTLLRVLGYDNRGDEYCAFGYVYLNDGSIIGFAEVEPEVMGVGPDVVPGVDFDGAPALGERRDLTLAYLRDQGFHGFTEEMFLVETPFRKASS